MNPICKVKSYRKKIREARICNCSCGLSRESFLNRLPRRDSTYTTLFPSKCKRWSFPTLSSSFKDTFRESNWKIIREIHVVHSLKHQVETVWLSTLSIRYASIVDIYRSNSTALLTNIPRVCSSSQLRILLGVGSRNILRASARKS